MTCANLTKFVAVPLSVPVLLGMSVATEGQTAAQKTASTAKTPAKGPVDLNKASVEEIEAGIPGIPPAVAKNIVAGRPYKSLDELVKAGVRPRMLERIRPLVTLGAAMPAKSEPTAATAKKPEDTKSKVAAAAPAKVAAVTSPKVAPVASAKVAAQPRSLPSHPPSRCRRKPKTPRRRSRPLQNHRAR